MPKSWTLRCAKAGDHNNRSVYCSFAAAIRSIYSSHSSSSREGRWRLTVTNDVSLRLATYSRRLSTVAIRQRYIIFPVSSLLRRPIKEVGARLRPVQTEM